MAVITYIAGILAALFLIVGLANANGAPQEAAAAAVAVAIAVIPYSICATARRATLIRQGRQRFSDPG